MPVSTIQMRVTKYIPDRLFGFCSDPESEKEVFFHLKVFDLGAPANARCAKCDDRCTWGGAPPPPVLGEAVTVEVDLDAPTDGKAPRAIGIRRLEAPIAVEGIVDTFDPKRGFGFIQGSDGVAYHLHTSEIIDNRVPLVSQTVMFYAGTRQGRPRACHVRVCG